MADNAGNICKNIYFPPGESKKVLKIFYSSKLIGLPLLLANFLFFNPVVNSCGEMRVLSIYKLLTALLTLLKTVIFFSIQSLQIAGCSGQTSSKSSYWGTVNLSHHFEL